MCLSIPAQVISTEGDEALVSVNGVSVAVSTMFLTGLKPGDFVLIHSGFAIQTIDPAEARKTLNIIRHMRSG